VSSTRRVVASSCLILRGPRPNSRSRCSSHHSGPTNSGRQFLRPPRPAPESGRGGGPSSLLRQEYLSKLASLKRSRVRQVVPPSQQRQEQAASRRDQIPVVPAGPPTSRPSVGPVTGAPAPVNPRLRNQAPLLPPATIGGMAPAPKEWQRSASSSMLQPQTCSKPSKHCNNMMRPRSPSRG
jgi:hypothetical protein